MELMVINRAPGHYTDYYLDLSCNYQTDYSILKRFRMVTYWRIIYVTGNVSYLMDSLREIPRDQWIIKAAVVNLLPILRNLSKIFINDSSGREKLNQI